jgi:hypothetical protein
VPTREQVSSQRLANSPPESPTAREPVRAWLKARVAADEQMRAAMRERTAKTKEGKPEEGAA